MAGCKNSINSTTTEPLKRCGLITGGAQYVGEAIARTIAGAGAKVMIADLNGDKAAATVEKIAAETSQEVLGMKCDVTDELDWKKLRCKDCRGIRWNKYAV